MSPRPRKSAKPTAVRRSLPLPAERLKQSRLNFEKLFPDYDPEVWEGVILFDDMDEAFVGLATQFTNEPVAVYDYAGCIECLKAQGMTDDEATEWFSFNTQGAWVGPRTPMVINFRKDSRRSNPDRALFSRARGTKSYG